MKREIKFRAWIPNTGWLAEGFSIAMDGTEWYDDNGHSWPVCDLEIMQFTGLHDKNGKEIYEGDIVQWEDTVDDGYGCGYLTKIQEEVIFGGGAYNPISTMPSKYFEVIGNIYENPELLKA
jgi:hypothetical protein